MALSVVLQHIIDCVRAAVTEAEGKEEEAARLRAQCKLRLVCMTDEEVGKLAEITCHTSGKTHEQAIEDLHETIEHYKQTSDEWLGDLTEILSPGAP